MGMQSKGMAKPILNSLFSLNWGTSMPCKLTLWLLVVLWGVNLSISAPPSAEASVEPFAVLEKTRAGRHERYSSVVFQFGSKIQYEKPIIRENEIFVKLKNVKTTLSPLRTYKAIDSWVRLEKEGNDLNAHIGLPSDFGRMKDYFLENPHRLVIDLYGEGKSSSPSPEKGATPVPVEVTEAKETDSNKAVGTIDPPRSSSTGRKSDTVIPFSDDGLLTLNFHQVDIREVLSAIAMQREENIATAKDVSGEISVHLYKATFDEALDAITLAGGCRYRKYKDLYYIYKPKEDEKPEIRNLRMRIFQLKYAEVNKVQEILDALTDMRMVKMHEPSKTIIVEDTPENIKRVETIIRHWDTKPRQVIIEAKILEINLTDDMSLGVDWEKVLGDARIAAGGFSRAVIPTTTPVSPVPTEGTGVFANILTATGTRGQFTAALDALQAKTTINALSTPKVLAIHGKPAKVQVGGEQGYRVTTVSEGIATETIEFIDTGIVLEITPYIDEEDNVLLKVQPSVTSAVLEEGIPVTSTALVTTWLLAKSGETAFIGGLIQDSKTRASEAIPCLGSIPVLGILFGKTFRGIDRSELVVLITPRIVDDEIKQQQQEVIEKTKKQEEIFKKEPLPPQEQFRDFLLPGDEKSGEKAQESQVE